MVTRRELLQREKDVLRITRRATVDDRFPSRDDVVDPLEELRRLRAELELRRNP